MKKHKQEQKKLRVIVQVVPASEPEPDELRNCQYFREGNHESIRTLADELHNIISVSRLHGVMNAELLY